MAAPKLPRGTPNPSIESLTRVFVRPMGSSLPLGFFSFSIGTFLLTALQAGWIPLEEKNFGALFLALFPAPLEGMAMILAFLTRDTAGGTIMGLFSASWLCESLFVLGSQRPDQPNAAMAFLSAGLAFAMFLLGAVGVRSKPFFATLLFFAGLRTAVNAAILWGASGWVKALPTPLGIFLVAIGLYGAVALLFEDSEQGAVLPLFRKGKSKRAVDGNLREQIQRLASEPGVRHEL